MSQHTTEMTVANFEQLITTHDTVVIDAWASWCGPCRAFAPIFEAAATRHPEVTWVKLDTEAQGELASAFRIRAIPTLLVFRQGVLLFEQAGMLPGPALDELVNKVRALDMDEVKREIQQQQTKRAM